MVRSSFPQVSVVMPVRNSHAFVDAAIKSILEQDFEDFEFVILDDASTDATLDRLRAWERLDPRIRLIEQDVHPLGLVGSSRRVVEESQASLIARMDADDVSRPDRLRRQFAVMTEHPDAVLVGSLAEGIDASGKEVRPVELARLVPGRTVLPCPHPTMMFRRAAFDRVGGYPDGSEGWEDTALFARLSSSGRVFVIAEPLLRYRYHVNGSTVSTEHRFRVNHQAKLKAFLNEVRAGVRAAPDSERCGAAEAYLLRAGMRVWSGVPVDLDPAFPSRSEPGWFAKAMRVGLYATWGRTAPRAMRMLMRARIRLNNRRFDRFRRMGVVEWDIGP